MREVRTAYLIAWRTDFTGDEILDRAVYWAAYDAVRAWVWREAWAIRCVEGRHE